MKRLQDLINLTDPGWPIVKTWIDAATIPVEVLPADPSKRDQALLEAQVSTRSPMGAIVYETGGILVDHGWLRILGSGHDKLPRVIMAWNKACNVDPSSHLLIADDVVGGFFALNGGGLGDDLGKVYYFAPDTLKWEPLGIGYSQFVEWSFSKKLATFYQTLRWTGWEAEVEQVRGDQALSFYPFLWSKEGKDLGKNSRKAAPVTEVYGLNVIEFPKQLDG